MSGEIVVLGATGYAGGLVVESLLARGRQPVLAGRRPDRLAAMASDLEGLPFRIADVDDPATLADLAGPGDVLVTTVGPFERFGHPVADAAAAAGAHYVDATGEVAFVQELQRRHHRRARAVGATMLPAFGYDYVPGILAGALAARRAGAGATSLRIGYFATGPLRKGLSQGTRATMADGLVLPALVWRDRTLARAEPASSVRRFPVRGRRRQAFLVSGTEVLFLPSEVETLATVEVFNGWFPSLSRGVQASSWLANRLAARPVGRRIAERMAKLTVGPAGGPDADERSRTRSHIVAVAADDGNVVSEVHVEGPSIYTLTADLMAQAADALVSGQAARPGVLGPIQAFGLDGLVDLCAAAGLQVTDPPS